MAIVSTVDHDVVEALEIAKAQYAIRREHLRQNADIIFPKERLLLHIRIEAGVAPDSDVGRTFLEFRDQLAPADRTRFDGHAGAGMDEVSLHQRHDDILDQIRSGNEIGSAPYRETVGKHG